MSDQPEPAAYGATDPADERGFVAGGVVPGPADLARDARELLADLTHEAVDAGTYGEPSPEMAPADSEPFEGHQPRECGEHRTTGRRAWCFDCSEWCYPNSPCVRCELPVLRAELAAARASEAVRGDGSPTPDVGAAQGREDGSAAESEPRVHYEVEMYNDGWSIPIYRTSSVDDAGAHEEPAVTSASTRIVRVTREVIQ